MNHVVDKQFDGRRRELDVTSRQQSHHLQGDLMKLPRSNKVGTFCKSNLIFAFTLNQLLSKEYYYKLYWYVIRTYTFLCVSFFCCILMAYDISPFLSSKAILFTKMSSFFSNKVIKKSCEKPTSFLPQPVLPVCQQVHCTAYKHKQVIIV